MSEALACSRPARRTRYYGAVPFILIPLGLLLLIAFIPLLLLIRFRLGSARRRARPWIANLNVVVLAISTSLFLASATIVNSWVPNAFKFALAGLVSGALLSTLGLAFTRWDETHQAVFYKPNRWFALIIPLALTLRITSWMWRAWHTWSGSADTRSWLAASGTAGSMGAGATVAGYYFGYAVGVWRRVIHSKRARHLSRS
jgi:hypothetical protein